MMTTDYQFIFYIQTSDTGQQLHVVAEDAVKNTRG